ncbi:MAG: hypothetical protein VR70_13810 [Rhodospirillaceae bacterium BRH_c57]|nr:MAG: hypothetical protein VR70_13810 [Rhodospirillaceae bacterium BRH_c57]
MPFAAMINDLFFSPAMSTQAEWSGVGPVRVIQGKPLLSADGLDGLRLSPSSQVIAARVDVRVTDVAEPLPGQTVTVGGRVYPVLKGAEIDELGLTWSVPLGKGVPV